MRSLITYAFTVNLCFHCLPMRPLFTYAFTVYLCVHCLPMRSLFTYAFTVYLRVHCLPMRSLFTYAFTVYLCVHCLPMRSLFTYAFTVYLCAILFVFRDRLPHSVELDYRLDGKLFNMSRLKAKTKVMKTAVVDLQYADDCAIFSHCAEELQTSLDLFTEVYQGLGLSINIRKTKVIHQTTPGINAGPPKIKVSGGILEVVEHFPYNT